MKHVRMIGKLESPIVSKKNYKLGKWKIAISSKSYKDKLLTPYERYSNPRFYGKFAGENSRPFNYIAHCGYVHLDFESDSPEKDIKDNCKIKQLGKMQNEGMGKIRWENFYVFKENKFDEIKIVNKKIKLKKLNINEIPEEMYPLFTAGLIHDLVHVPHKHPSKINSVIEIEDEDIKFLVQNHHNKINNVLLKRLQRADKLASMMERKHIQPSKTNIGYGKDEVSKTAKFEIKKNIENNISDFPRLYDYIWNEKRLDNFVESQKYGLSSLRRHLLLTVQLLVVQ